jgi:hypothetical protein
MPGRWAVVATVRGEEAQAIDPAHFGDPGMEQSRGAFVMGEEDHFVFPA